MRQPNDQTQATLASARAEREGRPTLHFYFEATQPLTCSIKLTGQGWDELLGSERKFYEKPPYRSGAKRPRLTDLGPEFTERLDCYVLLLKLAAAHFIDKDQHFNFEDFVGLPGWDTAFSAAKTRFSDLCPSARVLKPNHKSHYQFDTEHYEIVLHRPPSGWMTLLDWLRLSDEERQRFLSQVNLLASPHQTEGMLNAPGNRQAEVALSTAAATEETHASVTGSQSRARTMAALSGTFWEYPDASPTPLEQEDPMSHSQLIAEVFLDNDWTTYALAALETDTGTQDPVEDERRVEALTRLLMKQNAESLERAASMLAAWLSRNPTRPRRLTFQLRRVFCLRGLKQYSAAARFLEEILKDHPVSAPLHCLYGNILGNISPPRNEQALEALDRAAILAPDWPEPQLEAIEKYILVGQAEAAAQRADDFLQRHPKNARVQILLQALRVIAKVFCEPGYYESKECEEEMIAIRRIDVPDTQREVWNFNDVRRLLVKSSVLSNEKSLQFIDWLKTLEERVRP